MLMVVLLFIFAIGSNFPSSVHAATLSQATSLVTQAEIAGDRLHTLYTTPNRYHVISYELTLANQAFYKANQAVSTLNYSTEKTRLVNKLHAVSMKIYRTRVFNNAIYAAADSYKKIKEIEEIIYKPTINQTTLKPRYDAFAKMKNTLEMNIKDVYGDKVRQPLYERYVIPARATEEVVREILQDKKSPLYFAPSVSGGRTIQIPVMDWSNLNPASVYNKDNYILDGKPLPPGSIIKWMKMTPRNVITIILPEETVQNNQQSTLVLKGLKDQMGNTSVNESEPFPITLNRTVDRSDNIKPELISVTQISNEKLRLEFSEKIENITPFDFKVTLNGNLINNDGGLTGVRFTPVADDKTGKLFDAQVWGFYDFDPDSVVSPEGKVFIETKIYETGPEYFNALVNTIIPDANAPIDFFNSQITFTTLRHTVSTDASNNRNLLKGETSISLTLKNME